MGKKISALVFVMALGVSFLPAQVRISEEVIRMSMGERNSLSVVLEGMNEKLVANSWKDFMARYGKTKKSKGEWVTKQVVIRSIDESSPLTILAKTSGTGDGVTLSVWFDLGGTFLASSQEPEKCAAAEEFLREFFSKASEDGAAAQLADAQAELEQLESRLDRLLAKNRTYENDIRRAENTIARAQQKMRESLRLQTEIQGQISVQNMAVQEAERRLREIKR
jgi:hypothetical protein